MKPCFTTQFLSTDIFILKYCLCSDLLWILRISLLDIVPEVKRSVSSALPVKVVCGICQVISIFVFKYLLHDPVYIGVSVVIKYFDTFPLIRHCIELSTRLHKNVVSKSHVSSLVWCKEDMLSRANLHPHCNGYWVMYGLLMKTYEHGGKL